MAGKLIKKIPLAKGDPVSLFKYVHVCVSVYTHDDVGHVCGGGEEIGLIVLYLHFT